jgi:hypothetical protein
MLAPTAFGSTYLYQQLNPGGSVNQFGGGGINNNNQVAATASSHLFVYDLSSNSYTNYFSVVPAQMGSIDDSGKVVYTVNSGGGFEGAIFNPSDNSVTTFNGAAGSQYTFANGVSSDGNFIAAYYQVSTLPQIGLRKSGSTSTDVSYPGPHGQVYLYDTNNAGDVIGLSACCRSGVNFLDKGGVYTTITDPLGNANNGVVNGMNNLDQVVGWYDNGTGGPMHGYLWQDGLSTTIDYPGAAQTILNDINDSGVILGVAVNINGSAFLFLAEPLDAPEPATLVLIGGALLAMAWKLRRKGVGKPATSSSV